jgi:N6-L-threonylcarbamoyladenine synthase
MVTLRLVHARRSLHHLRHLTVLALESSADDTCAAVVTSSGKILSNVVLKQHHVYVYSPFDSALLKPSPELLYRHEPFGGIHPYRAVQAHQRNMVCSSSPPVHSR